MRLVPMGKTRLEVLDATSLVTIVEFDFAVLAGQRGLLSDFRILFVAITTLLLVSSKNE